MKYINDLNQELANLYHNASIPLFKNTSESDFVNDLFSDFQTDYNQSAFDDLQFTCPEILNYGEVYQWGRGKRTVAPNNLIRQREGGTFSIKKAEELELHSKDARELTRVLKKFNQLVNEHCKNTESAFLQFIKNNELESVIKENENKKRTSIVVYR